MVGINQEEWHIPRITVSESTAIEKQNSQHKTALVMFLRFKNPPHSYIHQNLKPHLLKSEGTPPDVYLMSRYVTPCDEFIGPFPAELEDQVVRLGVVMCHELTLLHVLTRTGEK